MQASMKSILNQTAQLTVASCGNTCDASGLVSNIKDTAMLKAAGFSTSDLDTPAFLAWTGNVPEVVAQFKLAALTSQVSDA